MARKFTVAGGCNRLGCDHSCYNICRHEDWEGQLRFRPKLALRVIAALIAALIAGVVSGPAVIQATLESGGRVGAWQVFQPPAAATPKITAAPSSAVPNQQVVLIGSGLATSLSLEVLCPTEGTKSRGLRVAL